MKIFISFALVFFATVHLSAQTPQSPAPSKPPPSSSPAPQQQQQPPPQQQQQQQPNYTRFPQTLDSREDQLRRLGQIPLNPVSESDRLSDRVVLLHRMIGPLYRNPSGKDLASLVPNPETVHKYSAFLHSEDTGIFMLVPDMGCVYSDRIVNVKEECLKYSFPGAGNSFSFRTEGHRLRHLADVTYVDDKLRITGIFMLGMIADIGDVPIENVTFSTPGMRSLTAFQPTTVPEGVIEINEKFAAGVTSEQFVYSKEADPKLDRTYILRVVAYRGKVIRSAGGVRYNELDYDKRRDAIVAFRVVEIGPDKRLTIVWRKLSETEAPKLKMPGKDPKEPRQDDDDDSN
jgi:hypothetical protein